MVLLVWNRRLETSADMGVDNIVSNHSLHQVLLLLYYHDSILTPIQAIGILIWYIVNEIVNNEDEPWYKFSRASLIMVLTQVSPAYLSVTTC